MRMICIALLILCDLTHPFHRAERLLFGTTCNLAELSWWVAKRFNVKGVWDNQSERKRYYQEYSEMCGL